ncbi:phage tail protein [Acinetobacter baumannii]|nr:phage tail protein [Acinetobacter baumannii]
MANLVFKFSWDHRPFPYNSAQGKRQFMLPFASGIPNLTPNWTQVTGLGTAATGTLTTSTTDTTSGRVLKVGDFGIGSDPILLGDNTSLDVPVDKFTSLLTHKNGTVAAQYGAGLQFRHPSGRLSRIFMGSLAAVRLFVIQTQLDASNNQTHQIAEVLHSLNTTTDSNGFVKKASPIVQLFSSEIKFNDEAEKQNLYFEKIDIGDYLLKGSLGFAQEGWYIEVPKDANGNTVVAVEYSTLENGDLSIKTYKRKFDFELAAVVADHENPMDIPEGRWIDIRLHEEPEPEPDEPLSETPVDFQPTNLSQAVAAAMNGVEPPEISDTNETL